MAEKQSQSKWGEVKVWRWAPDSEAGIQITPTGVFLVGNSKNFIAIDNKGITIQGPVGFGAMGENIRRAGLFSEQNDFVKMIPSTIVTPLPSILPSTAIVGTIFLCIRDVAFMTAMLIG